MFLFTTTTVINNLKDFTTGKDLIVVDKKGANANDPVILIKRHNPFRVSNIACVYKAQHTDPKVDVVTIPNLISATKDKRVKLYIKSVGNADPMYANVWVFKGKPVYFEVPAGTTADDLTSIVLKYMNFVFGGEALLTAEVEGQNLVITCINPYQRVSKVTVAERQEPTGDGFGGKNEAIFGEGTDITATAVTPGHEGFGDYDHMIKDLRLPTGANLRWKRTMEDEMPTPGAYYDQYTLYYEVDRGVMGLGAVGMKATSQTTHVFWVNSAIAEDFDAILESAGVTTTAKKLTEINTSAKGTILNTADDTHTSGTEDFEPSILTGE